MRQTGGLAAGFGTLALALVGGLMSCATIEPPGRRVYDEHCVMCHGAQGRGDGYFAERLLTLPPDLTRLAQDNGGTFPTTRVTLAITGEGRDSHFSGAMPDLADLKLTGRAADRQLAAVVAYLETIQQ